MPTVLVPRNRHYDRPNPENHEGIWAVRRILSLWSKQSRLLLGLLPRVLLDASIRRPGSSISTFMAMHPSVAASSSTTEAWPFVCRGVVRHGGPRAGLELWLCKAVRPELAALQLGAV